MSGQLTTHVLDIMRGQPARGMKVEIWALFEGGRKQIRSAMTNDDGRLDAPLLAAPKMKAGLYEICFHVPLLVSPWYYSTYRGS
jgi:5-hydroxyisourate hydrolase